MSDTETIDHAATEEAPRPRQELALAPSRLPMSKAIAKEFDIDPTQWRVLVEQTFPSAKTPEAVLMALSYCRARNLDIFKKPVHIVPMWSSDLGRMIETVWPGIAEIRTTAARTGEYAGIDEVQWGPMIEHTFSGSVGRGQRAETVTKTLKFPEWASVVVYRIVKGQRSAFHTKVFWEETYATIGKSDVPNDMWTKRPRGQLDKCVEAAGLRKAFPEEVGSMYAAEEMEGRIIEGAALIQASEPPTPPSPPSAPVSQIATSNDAPKRDAADFNDDASEVTDQPESSAEFLARIEHELSFAMSAENIEEAFDLLDVPTVLSGDDASLTKAFATKQAHLARAAKAVERPFPLDVPLTKEQKP